jgi:IclR family acetate operon transcriptional repressor
MSNFDASPMKTVAKALLVLKQFKYATGELGVTDISKAIEVDKVIVHRLLKTLAMDEFVIALASQNLRHVPIAQMAKPWLEKVQVMTNETVMLTVRRGSDLVVAFAIESEQPVRVTAQAGDVAPMHCTAAGKLYLAFGPQSLFETILVSGLPKMTPNTLTTPEKLRKDLKKIKAQGWSSDNEEMLEGIKAVAVPLLDKAGDIQACIAIRGPAHRMTPQRISSWVEELVTYAKECSRELNI